MFRGIFIGAAALVWAASAAAAQAPSSDPAATLAREVKAADAAGRQPPRLSDAAAAGRIHAAFDPAPIAGMAGMDMGAALDVCGSRIEAMVAYTLFDLDQQGVTHDTPPEEAARTAATLMARNSGLFQDEISLGLRFQLRCTAALAPAMERFIQTLSEADRTPIRRQGAAQARASAARMLSGVAIMASESGLRSANRDLVLDEAVLQADALAGLMARDDRTAAIAAIDAVSPRVNDAGARESLSKIRASLSIDSCGAVCAF